MLQSWYFDTNFIVKAPLHYVNDKNWAVKSPHHNQCPPCPPPWHAESGSRSAQCLQSPAQLIPGTLLTAPYCPLTACMTACMTAVTALLISHHWLLVQQVRLFMMGVARGQCTRWIIKPVAVIRVKTQDEMEWARRRMSAPGGGQRTFSGEGVSR